MRTCSGIFPLQQCPLTTVENQEILKPILDAKKASEAQLVGFLPTVSPCSISINYGDFMPIEFLETSENSASISSIRVATIGTSYMLQVEY